MSDYFQNGVIATFHRLGEVNIKNLEGQLKEFGKRRPIALILPSLYREFASGALQNITKILKNATYFNQIVLCLDRANADQFKKVKDHFSSHKRFFILWNDGPRMKKIYETLEKNDLSPGKAGKGRAVWIALGYVLAGGKSRVIAFHDCDIVNYSRSMVARLCYPVASPHSEYEFCKGFYSRYTTKMYGRATRLFFTPLTMK